MDLTVELPAVTKETKQHLHGLRFSEQALTQMLLAFVNAKLQGQETIVCMAGLVHNDMGYVFKAVIPKLSVASSVCAETDHAWLLNWISEIRQTYPFVNLIVQAHIHPLGSILSHVDERGLLNLSDWHSGVYFASLVFDFDLGCYAVNDGRIEELWWEVEGLSGNKPSVAAECFATSRLSWATRIFGRLSRRP
jgi:hypothetical protein